MRHHRSPHAARATRAGAVAIPLAAILAGAALLFPAGRTPHATPALPAGDTGTSVAAHAVAAGAPERDAVSAPRGTGHYRAPRGSRFAFRLTGATVYGIALAGERRDPSRSMALRFDGTMVLDVLDRRDGEIAVALEIADFRLRNPQAGADAELARQSAAIARPLLVRMREDGAITGYRFDPTVDAEQRNFVRAVVAAVSFTVPADAGATWRAPGEDATGRYVAAYEALARDESHLAVRRTKLRYDAVAAALDAVPAHEIEGDATARLSCAMGWLHDVQVDERLRMALPMMDGALVMQLRAKLVLAEASRTPAAALARDPWGDDWAPACGAAEAIGAHADREERERWRAQLRGVSLDGIVAELAALLESNAIESRAWYDAWTKLVRMIEIRPQVCAEIRQQVLGGRATGELADALMTALGGAGTPPAQAVLAALRADHGLDAAMRESAAIAMAQLAEPTTDLLEGLAGELRSARDVRQSATAMMVLGTLAPRHPEPLASGRTPMQSLIVLEERARRLDAVDTWLDSLGNTGNRDILPHVHRHLDTGSERVRESAVFALRHVPGTDVAADLIRRAGEDASVLVRSRALEVLGRRPEPAAREVLRRAARLDAEPAVRRTAILALGDSLGRDAESRSTLDRIAREDRDAGMRDLARRVLESAGDARGS